MGSDGVDGDGGQVYPGAAGQDQGGQGAGQDNTGHYDPSLVTPVSIILFYSISIYFLSFEMFRQKLR